MLVLPIVLLGCTLGLQSLPALTGDSGISGGVDCVDDDDDGYETCDGDCDDSDALTYPGAAPADSGDACMTDGDGDGYGDDSPAEGVRAGSDCDDADPQRSPGEEEVPFDGSDSDCDGEDGGVTVTVEGEGGVTVGDYDTVSSIASVSGCSEVIDLLIDVEIVHSYIGDLTVSISAPGGPGVTLHSRAGGAAEDIIGTYAPDGGGSLTAAQSLAPLIGVAGNGSWRLTVADGAIGDFGRLVAWSLTLDCP